MSDDKIAELEARLAALESKLAAIAAVFTAGSSAGANVASDRDLDGKYGNEKIRFNPRDWDGRPYKGANMSQAEPDFLELYADAMEYFAGKEPDATKAGYNRKTAARARGWAERLRKGWKPAVRQAPPAAPASDFRVSYAQPAQGFDETGFGDDGGNPFADEVGDASFPFGNNAEEERL